MTRVAVGVALALAAAQVASPDGFESADRTISQAIASGVFSGVVLQVGRSSGPVHLSALGRVSAAPGSAFVEANTIFDLASLSKAVATATVVMVLVDRGELDLGAPVSKWFPELGGPERERITVRDLLAHSSGLPEWEPLYKQASGKDAILRRIAAMDPMYAPGTRSVYSDLGMILLGAIVERQTRMGLDEAARRLVFEPLGMLDTVFTPRGAQRARAAATGESVWRGRALQGEVHDENAYRMGGVAGHAGVFSPASELGRLAEMLLARGAYSGRRLVRTETVALFTTGAGIPESSRTLGWALARGDPWAGDGWSEKTFGHTGNTGVALWIDPVQDVYLVLLTNRTATARNEDAFSRVRRKVCDEVLRRGFAR